eukprot:TRINITY_DN23566_c0_g1_i1.p1 TRINITY_DN23566_c0_g1~~TRINITY_DN23566_c0_g1_i1.p1  ORF type:complete len:171 (+),score=55.99 TRINITY_DN23566_c0_g1_i1:27-539(+)
MAILSRLAQASKVMVTSVRHGGGIGGQIHNRPSRWNWDLFKDHLHFYIMLGAIPIGMWITMANIMKGPAVLSPIPEGYVPQEHEYYKSPITRWFVKNIYNSYQEVYESYLGTVWEEEKKRCMYQLYQEARRQQKLHQDYKGWYTKLKTAEYMRMSMKSKQDAEEARGFEP